MPPITTATNANSLTITQAVNKVSPSKFANAPIGPGDRIKISSPPVAAGDRPKRVTASACGRICVTASLRRAGEVGIPLA